MHRVDGAPLLLAGLWEVWERPGVAPLTSCTIMVGPPNVPVAKIEDRVPTLVRPDEVDRWLDPAEPSDEVEAYRVEPAVNDARNDGPRLVARLGS